jgi:hypothetical protein
MSYVKLYIRDINKSVRVPIRYNKEYFFEKHINNLGINPEHITYFGLGPGLVMEAYEGPQIVGRKRTIINNTPNEMKINSGAYRGDFYNNGIIRSFVIYKYDFFNAVKHIRFCNKHSQCKDYEYCLCQSGQKDPSYCPKSGRRCMHVSNYLRSIPRRLNP